MVEAFGDHRYITIDGRPIFLVFRPQDLPEPKQFTDCWRESSLKSGLKEIYFIGIVWKNDWKPAEYGFDASIPNHFHLVMKHFKQPSKRLVDKIFRRLTHKELDQVYRDICARPRIILYEDMIRLKLPPFREDIMQYPM